MKTLIKTYGCQMNKRDSEAVSALLSRHGHDIVGDESEARLILVNTCSVREKAEAKALGKLGLLVSGKRRHPGRIVGAIGCMVQRLSGSIFEKVPGLDFAVGPNRLSSIPAIVDLVLAGKGPVLDAPADRREEDILSCHEEGEVSGFVNILLGCDRRCTYCIVPAVRGEEWSRPLESVREEVAGLAAAGVREVVLLGQSVMAYGRRNEVTPRAYLSRHGYNEPLCRLLEAVDAVHGIERVRFTSGHPSGCTEELARAMAELPGTCEHLHLPLQSGSDRILRKMARGYTTADYRLAVKRLRDAVPGMALTTDVIVGFPSETEEDFEATVSFMDEIGFDNAFIFKYSPRPGTPAAEWRDDVADAEKQERNRILLEHQDLRALRMNERLVGTVVEVLVTGESLRNASRWAGRTRTNKITVFDRATQVKPGELVNLRIERAGAQTLYGTPVQECAGNAAVADSCQPYGADKGRKP